MNDQNTLSALQKGQAAYEKIVNKELHYVYLKNNKYQELVIHPKKHNFLHLCGINYFDPKTGKKYNANQFYDFLKKNKINLQGIVKKSSAEQKLQIIDQLNDLTKCNLRIIDDKTTYFNLVFYRGIRSSKRIFALALENESRSDHWVPSSLLNLKNGSKGTTIKKGNPVHCIYSVESKLKIIQPLCKTEEFIEYETKNEYIYRAEPQML